MVEITEKATEMIKEFLKEKNEQAAIRFIVSGGGWAGPSVRMVLDEPTQDDEIFDRDDVRYIVEKKLLETIQPVHVDFITRNGMSGFVIKSGLVAGGGCGSCSSC